jgi:methionyl-tRNA formyltransferase
MRCAFSAPPLRALIASGLDLRAVVLPAPAGSPPVQRLKPAGDRFLRLRPEGAIDAIDHLAESAGVPVLAVRELRHPDVAATLAQFKPDLIVVACFPWLIPPEIRAIPPLGALNLHPSLLPRWRGPEPLFWTFKQRDREAGVTVHRLAAGFDTGPILAQSRYPIAEGIDGRELERELARLGGELLVATIEKVANGTSIEVPQDEDLATFAPMPDDSDLILEPTDSARSLYNVIRGIAPLWGPLTMRFSAPQADVTVHAALDFDETYQLEEPFVRAQNTLLVDCNPGVLTLLSGGNERLHTLTAFVPV